MSKELVAAMREAVTEVPGLGDLCMHPAYPGRILPVIGLYQGAVLVKVGEGVYRNLEREGLEVFIRPVVEVA